VATVTTTKRAVPVTLWALRLAGVMFALAVLGQAVFAGLFVTGDLGMLTMHQVNAVVVVASALLWILAAIVLAVADRAPARLVVLGVIALVLTVAQMAVGGSRVLWLHIPMGVGMFALAVRLVAVAFAYGRDRS
jgi:hypothetical protein